MTNPHRHYAPAEIVRARSHYRSVESGLDMLLVPVRAAVQEGRSRWEILDTIAGLLSDPVVEEGPTLTPEEHAGTLANMLAVAVERIVSQEES